MAEMRSGYARHLLQDPHGNPFFSLAGFSRVIAMDSLPNSNVNGTTSEVFYLSSSEAQDFDGLCLLVTPALCFRA
jgi:hypothetical protein